MTLNPASFTTTPVFLFDADSITGSDDDDVTGYTDLSGAGNNIAGTATYPKLKTNPDGFGKALRFAGGKVMNGSFASFANNAYTIILVTNRFVGGTNFGGVLSLVATGTTNDQSTNGSWPILYTGGAILSDGTATTKSPSQGRVPIQANSGTQTTFPSLTYQSNTSSAAPATFGFGQRFQSSAWSTTLGASFDLHAAVIFDSALSAANLTADIGLVMSTILKRNTTLFPPSGGSGGVGLIGRGRGLVGYGSSS